MVSLGGNSTKSVLVFLSGILTARFLGADDYGRFSFLLGSFMIINELTDVGVNKIFFTRISSEKQSLTLWRMFIFWLFFRMCLIAILVWWIFPDNLIYQLWKDSPKNLILVAFFASFLNHELWKVLSIISESLRKTYLVQSFNIIIALTHLLAVIGLHLLNELSIKILFYLIILEYVACSLIILKILSSKRRFTNNKTTKLADEFCIMVGIVGPLVLYTLILFLYQFFDKWFLYKISGNKQHGFFAVGERLSLISMLFTTALANILWKEISEAFHEKDIERVRQLYSASFRFLYLIAVIISSCLFPHTEFIIHNILGYEYLKGDLALKIMLLNPIPMTLAYCLGTLLYATSKTKTISLNSILFIVVGMPITYFMIAPSTYYVPGLHLGATGLAIKFVATHLIVINLLNYSTQKIFDTSMNLAYQLYVPFFVFISSYSVYFFCIFAGLSDYPLILISIFTHLIIVTLFIYFFRKKLLGKNISKFIDDVIQRSK